jgi:glycosyltransferase involved in cell wall biosynthesis
MCLLTIAIPTYNRAVQLGECLIKLLPQLVGVENVEVLICDNASSDATPRVIAEAIKEHVCVRSVRNDKNLGFDGNFCVAIDSAAGEYVAMLSDDDFYVSDAVQVIINQIRGAAYSMVAINYAAVGPGGAIRKVYAPTKDRVFANAYDLWDYPSVSHFSGLVYNRELARNALSLWRTNQITHPQKAICGRKGAFVEVAVCSISKSNLPAKFIGNRLVCVTEPPQGDVNTVPADYRKVHELVLDYICMYKRFVAFGYYPRERMKYRLAVASSSLLSLARICWPRLSSYEVEKLFQQLDIELSGVLRYRFFYRPVLLLARSGMWPFVISMHRFIKH